MHYESSIKWILRERQLKALIQQYIMDMITDRLVHGR